MSPSPLQNNSGSTVERPRPKRYLALVIVALLAALTIAAAPARPAAAQQSVSFVTIAGTDAGWALTDGDRQWLSPACRAELEVAGATFTLVTWSTIASGDVVQDPQSCTELLALVPPAEPTEPPGPTTFVTLAGTDAGWAMVAGTRQWLPPSCRTELEAVGIVFVLVTWAEIGPSPVAATKQGCGELADGQHATPPPEVSLQLVIASRNAVGGFVLDGATRQWINATCRGTIEALGHAFGLVSYGEIGPLPKANPGSTCDAIIAGLDDLEQPPPPVDPIELALTGSLEIDNTDRASVMSFYRDVIAPLEILTPEWTGNAATCDSGTISDQYRRGALAMINALRELAGDLGPVTFETSLDDQAQAAALIIEANQFLSHNLPNTLDCWSFEGAVAARNSNIALGFPTLGVLTKGYIFEPGDVNSAVGHRRWILDPYVQSMGLGASLWANALWVVDINPPDDVPADAASIVSWPPPGFFPEELVPARWSMSFVGRDLPAGCHPNCVAFDEGAVTVTLDGAPLTFTVEHAEDSGPLGPTLVFAVDWDALANGSGDRVVEVSISYEVGSQERTHTWTTTIIDT